MDNRPAVYVAVDSKGEQLFACLVLKESECGERTVVKDIRTHESAELTKDGFKLVRTRPEWWK